MPKKKRRVRNIVLLASVSFVISLALFLFDVLATYENRSFDLFSRYLNPERASDRIVIIEIDQQSIDALSAESINWPWPRQVYAPIIEFASWPTASSWISSSPSPPPTARRMTWCSATRSRRRPMSTCLSSCRCTRRRWPRTTSRTSSALPLPEVRRRDPDTVPS